MIYSEFLIDEIKAHIGQLIQSDATPKKYARPLLEALDVISQREAEAEELRKRLDSAHAWIPVDERLPKVGQRVLVHAGAVQRGRRGHRGVGTKM